MKKYLILMILILMTLIPVIVSADAGDVYSVDAIIGNMRYIPPTGPTGFVQGTPETEPCHEQDEAQFTHILTQTLAVMETEVTRAMWDELKRLRPDLPGNPTSIHESNGLDNPVQWVRWNETILFANILSSSFGYSPCYYVDADFSTVIDATNYQTYDVFFNANANGYRLPTEGEWEYFCRAGTTGAFSFDEPNYTECGIHWCDPEEFPEVMSHAIFCGNLNISIKTQSVGTKLCNPWHLMDVHGNVWEWCWDKYSKTYPVGTQTDYRGPATGWERVCRGGSFTHPAKSCRSGNRNFNAPDRRAYSTGFRLVRTIQ